MTRGREGLRWPVILTAIVSLLTRRRVRGDGAMTGEITLRDSVLPLGGLRKPTG
jgi:ATP-dependent Lon protease